MTTNEDHNTPLNNAFLSRGAALLCPIPTELDEFDSLMHHLINIDHLMEFIEGASWKTFKWSATAFNQMHPVLLSSVLTTLIKVIF